MKYIPIFILAVLLFSCNENKKTSGNEDQPFFHFDKIEHYHTDMARKDLQAIELKEDKTREEQALLQILTGNIPVSIKDTLFIKNMEILGFDKDTIDSGLNPRISHLFSLREISGPVAANCSAGFRDVLIFRKNGRIVGMAKISFECLRHQMIGERYNDSGFGQSGEYKELEKLLKQ
jgi:hypothetical protein